MGAVVSLNAVRLAQHATGRLAAMSGAAEPLLADRVLAGLGEAQLRARPAPCLNSIAWLLWHLARSEDVLVNVLLANTPQVLDAGGWPARLGLTERDMGTGMTSAQVDAISARVALPALLDYLVAVGRHTRMVLTGLDAADWVGAVAPERLLAAGAFADPTEGARRVASFWRGRARAELLASSLAPHNHQHLGEALAIKSLLVRQTPIDEPAAGIPAIVPSRTDKGLGESTFTALDVLAYAATRYSGATVAGIAFLTNGALRARRGHGEHLPDDTPLCLLTLHGAFSHSMPPFIRRLPLEVPIKNRLALTFHGVTGNLLTEAFGHERPSE